MKKSIHGKTRKQLAALIVLQWEEYKESKDKWDSMLTQARRSLIKRNTKFKQMEDVLRNLLEASLDTYSNSSVLAEAEEAAKTILKE